MAGEHFSGSQARSWLDLLVGALTEPGPFYTRFAIQYWDVHEIVSALVGLRRHFTLEDQIAILGFAKSLPDDASQILEAPLSRLLHHLDPAILDEQLAIYDTEVASSSWPKKLFRDLLAPRSTRARQSVRESLLSGDLTALSGANDVTQIESDEASVLLDKCDAAFETYKQPSNGITVGAHDYYRLATVLALNGPESMRPRAWDSIVAAIAETIDVPERKYSAIKIIARYADQVPELHSETLVAAARRLRSAPASPYADGISGLKQVGPVFTELLLELDAHAADWSDLLADLLAGDSEARRSACHVMGRRHGHEATLLALTRDTDQDVAARAVQGLAQRVASGPELPTAFASQLRRLSDQAGESIPHAILAGISTAMTLNDEAAALLVMLLEHASPAVRDDTVELIADRGWQVEVNATVSPTRT